jgi:hypothetical protein
MAAATTATTSRATTAGDGGSGGDSKVEREMCWLGELHVSIMRAMRETVAARNVFPSS